MRARCSLPLSSFFKEGGGNFGLWEARKGLLIVLLSGGIPISVAWVRKLMGDLIAKKCIDKYVID